MFERTHTDRSDRTDTESTVQHARSDDRPPADAGSTLAGIDLVLGYPGGDEPVVDGESIIAVPGGVTALVGPNGSGKSTLLSGLADQLAPDAGSVLVDGREISTHGSKALARKLGLLSQERAAPTSLTVEDLIYHGRYPHRSFFEHVTEADRRAVEEAMDLAGCRHLRDRDLGSLSGGQKQLAWIAMALAQETDVLLLDEPTTFLDVHHQLEVLEIVETLRREREVTVVVVLHDVGQAARLADRVVALQDGEIRACGPPAAVVTEELLADVFRVDAEVELTERGPRVTPLSPRHAPSEDRPGSSTTGLESGDGGASELEASGD